MTSAPEQLSVATTCEVMFGTVPWQFAPIGAVTEAGLLTMTGAVVSTTFKVTFVVALLPDASATVTLMLCWPLPTDEPASGF
jgi:hypothetical protein